MGKRSQARTTWKRHPEARPESGARRAIRVWVCADCPKQGVTLIRCADGRQRCATCKAGFDRVDRSVVVTR